MKRLIIILFFIPFICFAQLAKDKEAHLAFGTFFGIAGNGIVWELTGNKTLAFGSGVLLGSGIGIAKKLYDKNFSTMDLKYTIAGAILGSLTIRIAINKGVHRKNIPIYNRCKIEYEYIRL